MLPKLALAFDPALDGADAARVGLRAAALLEANTELSFRAALTEARAELLNAAPDAGPSRLPVATGG